MASADPSTTPNPDAMKFTLDVKLPASMNVTNPDDAAGNPFAEAVFAAGGVASVFGVNDFVTVTRLPGADWVPIVAAVEDAAARYLPACPGGPSTDDAVAQARKLLREATRRPATTAVDIQPRRR